MNSTWTEILKMLLSGGVLTGIFAIIANAMGWVRFSKKDKASVAKVESETAIDLAEVKNKEVDDEIKISNAALQWTVQLAGQLDKANNLNEKYQGEIERLHSVIKQMRVDFETSISALEEELKKVLDGAHEKLNEEKIINKELIGNLNKYIKNGGRGEK